MSGFKAKMHQIRFPLGRTAPDPLGELTALHRPLAVLNGPTSKAKEGKGRGWERGLEGKVKESEGETRWGGIWPTQKFWSGAPMIHIIRTVFSGQLRLLSPAGREWSSSLRAVVKA